MYNHTFESSALIALTIHFNNTFQKYDIGSIPKTFTGVLLGDAEACSDLTLSASGKMRVSCVMWQYDHRCFVCPQLQWFGRTDLSMLDFGAAGIGRCGRRELAPDLLEHLQLHEDTMLRIFFADFSYKAQS